MLKTVGILLVVCACAMAGIRATYRLKLSERRWKAWVTLLERLWNELRYTARPLEEVFLSAGKAEVSALPWIGEVHCDADGWCCPPMTDEQERVFAEHFFEHLGTTDLEGQLEHIGNCKSMASGYFEEAKQTCSRCAKPYAVTGVCAGLCLGLLLM